MKNLYIIQEKTAQFTWVDVLEVYDLRMARKYFNVLKNKHLDNTYRIVRWS